MTKTYTRKATNKKTQFICEVCGKVELGNAKSKFCSNACKQKDKYARSKK